MAMASRLIRCLATRAHATTCARTAVCAAGGALPHSSAVAAAMALSAPARWQSGGRPAPPGGRAPPGAGAGGRSGPPSGAGGAAAQSQQTGVLVDAYGNAIKRSPSPPPAGAGPRAAAGSAGGPRAGAPARGGAALTDADLIFNADESNFTQLVLQSPVPVILDCYADWCNPCKQLTPVLESIARSGAGALRLVKLDTDAQQGLAATLQVRSLPTVFGIVGGKLVDSFQGVVPQADLQRFLNALLTAGQKAGQLGPDGRPLVDIRGGGPPSPDALLDEANALVDSGEVEAAMEGLPALLENLQTVRARMEAEQDAAAGKSDKPSTRGLASGPLAQVEQLIARTFGCTIRALIAMGQKAAKNGGDAETMYGQARSYADILRMQYKTYLKHPDVSRALASLDLLASASEANSALAPLLAAVKANPTDVEALYKLAEAQIATGAYKDGIDTAIAALKREPGFRDGAIKTLLLKLFETLGPADPLVAAGRKAMSKALFR